jgi:hypothetical protein
MMQQKEKLRTQSLAVEYQYKKNNEEHSGLHLNSSTSEPPQKIVKVKHVVKTTEVEAIDPKQPPKTTSY